MFGHLDLAQRDGKFLPDVARRGFQFDRLSKKFYNATCQHARCFITGP